MEIETFLKKYQNDILKELELLVSELQADLKDSPNYYLNEQTERPGIDIRLCIDEGTRGLRWALKTGPVDYDLHYSDYCSASIVCLKTKAKDLLVDLIEGLE